MFFYSGVHSVTLSLLISLFILYLYLFFDPICPFNIFYCLYSCCRLLGGEPILHNSSQTQLNILLEVLYGEFAFECVCDHCVSLLKSDG